MSDRTETPNPNVPTETAANLASYGETFSETPARVRAALLAYLGVAEDGSRVAPLPLRVAAEAARVPGPAIERLAWSAEPVLYPSLRFDGADASAIVARANASDPFSRGGSPRESRLAIRGNVSPAKVRAAYESETGESFSSRYPGRGRRHAIARAGSLSPEDAKPLRLAVSVAKGEGLRGDSAILARAREIVAEVAAEESNATADDAPVRRTRRARS